MEIEEITEEADDFKDAMQEDLQGDENNEGDDKKEDAKKEELGTAAPDLTQMPAETVNLIAGAAADTPFSQQCEAEPSEAVAAFVKPIASSAF